MELKSGKPIMYAARHRVFGERAGVRSIPQPDPSTFFMESSVRTDQFVSLMMAFSFIAFAAGYMLVRL